MKKVACVIYPNFSLYEIVDLTSSLVLQYGIKVDYIAANKENILSEDGLICQATKTFDEVELNEYSCIVLPGMSDFTSALKDELLIQFLKQLKGKSIVIAAISSAPILLAKAGLLEDITFTGGIWQNFFGYFDFLSKENFMPKTIHQDKNIITAIGFAHQEFAKKVLATLGLCDDIEIVEKTSEELIFNMSDEEFAEFKACFEQS
ncbi:Putative intracellular protease/amidase [Streptococcus gallolyticus]|uniref:Putative intracellular protease/amidase n=1 Tax=Streptococcus gallolyticus TaxID=315405 RepID=A0A1I7J3S4_9STRE|nr:DJ-1/PfpI family protein [Streptococcus gallolyticus]SFC76815.1 Putative intracellular protease/amidase [Streptococcus gallolyticus]SFU79826.1 Putative intracellular protease/amidase [Streptococcus gallolyticus]